MNPDRKPAPPVPPPAADGPPAEPYQPPAVAWEEPFETMAATSCAAANPFDQNCQTRPVA
jgi:hypothetical protein